MPTYFYPNGQSVVVVNTQAQDNGDTLLRYELGGYNERYLRKPDKTKGPRWFVELSGIYMPVREPDVPAEIRMSWVYCYERTQLAVDLGPYYAT